jgi:ribosomal protein L11 methylase PrmA
VPTVAANVPPTVHAVLAPRLPAAVVHVIASGFHAAQAEAVVTGYRAAGFTELERRGEGWRAVLLERLP